MPVSVPHSLVQSLRKIPDFSTLDEDSVLTLVGESMNLNWNAGSIIFKPGTFGEALYVVLSGEVSIFDGDSLDDGEEVAHPKPGDSFGELSLLLNTTHSRTAMAVTDCEVLVLPREAFTQLLESNPALAAHFDEVLQSRMNDQDEALSP